MIVYQLCVSNIDLIDSQSTKETFEEYLDPRQLFTKIQEAMNSAQNHSIGYPLQWIYNKDNNPGTQYLGYWHAVAAPTTYRIWKIEI